jgi:DNA-binding response OmpR family regulator
LVVEDDGNVAEALVSVLRRRGYDVLVAHDGAEALDALGPGVDLVLLDVQLPDMDGFEVCQRIRQVSDVPVVMATARSGIPARVRGLELGADDYVTKPYDLRELLARIEAVLRRRARRDRDASQEPVEFGGLRVDVAAREVWLPDGTTAALTRKEFDLLVILVRHQGAVVPRQRLLHEVLGVGLGAVAGADAGGPHRDVAPEAGQPGPDQDGAQRRLPGRPRPGRGARFRTGRAGRGRPGESSRARPVAAPGPRIASDQRQAAQVSGGRPRRCRRSPGCAPRR